MRLREARDLRTHSSGVANERIQTKTSKLIFLLQHQVASPMRILSADSRA